MIPSVLDYHLAEKHNSLLNTPPVLAIHLCSLMLKWLEEQFPAGLTAIDVAARRKCDTLYAAITATRGRFTCRIDPSFRSRMNVVFHAQSRELEEVFLKEAEGLGMIQLRGHRSVGGLRASLYNSLEWEAVRELSDLLSKFQFSN